MVEVGQAHMKNAWPNTYYRECPPNYPREGDYWIDTRNYPNELSEWKFSRNGWENIANPDIKLTKVGFLASNKRSIFNFKLIYNFLFCAPKKYGHFIEPQGWRIVGKIGKFFNSEL